MKISYIKTLKATGIFISMVSASFAVAADYPGAQPIRLIVGAPPGGGGDTSARLVAEELGKVLKTQVVVENRPGAGGNIAAAEVARSKPDGHTFYYAFSSFVTNPALMSSMPFDTKTAFRSIGKIADNQSVLLVNPSKQISNFKEFVDQVKQSPGKYTFAGLQGSSQYVAGMLLGKKMDLNMLNVPYKGNSAAMNDLIGGQVDFMFNTVGVSLPFINSGKVKAIAVAGRKRSSLLSEIPTVAQASGTDFSAEGWYAIVVPSATPDDIITKAAEALQTVLKEPELKSKLAAIGADVDYREPREFDAFVASELDRWPGIVKEQKIGEHLGEKK